MAKVKLKTVIRLAKRAMYKCNKARAVYLQSLILEPGAIHVCNQQGKVYYSSRLIEFLEANWEGFEGPEGEEWYERLTAYITGRDSALNKETPRDESS